MMECRRAAPPADFFPAGGAKVKAAPPGKPVPLKNAATLKFPAVSFKKNPPQPHFLLVAPPFSLFIFR